MTRGSLRRAGSQSTMLMEGLVHGRPRVSRDAGVVNESTTSGTVV